MTTIVFRDGWVAYDTQAVRSGTVMPESLDKAWRIAGGGVAALCGEFNGSDDLKAWLDDGKAWEQPKIPENTILIVFMPDGAIVEHTSSGKAATKPLHGYYAWGSGQDAALGALAMGAKAHRAVEIAMMFDLGTGGTARQIKIVAENDDGA